MFFRKVSHVFIMTKFTHKNTYITYNSSLCNYFPSLALHGKLTVKTCKKKIPYRTTTGTATFFVHVLSKKKKSRYNIITHQNSVVDPDPNSIRSSEKNKFQLYRYRTQSFFLQENGKDIKNMMGESGSPTLESLI